MLYLHSFVLRATKIYWDTLKIARHHVYSKKYKKLKHFIVNFQERLRIMEVELGLKITKTRDDTTSVSDFQFAKDRSGPVFLSKETDATLILTAHLKGYKKQDIDINISKDGTEISVSGEKEVQEMQMIPFKRELKVKGFEKKFRIPDGVVLDRIKAKYNEEDALLTIVMPKTEVGKGKCEIEEAKEEREPSVPENVVDSVTPEEPEQSVPEEVPDKTEEETPPVKERGPKQPWTPCPPLVFGGSTLLVTLIFLVIHYIRARKS
ncbi:17.6 kDa class I heat shock protein 1 [Spatholobus suberectus]|nr:17.6 kDa class I heat shock protein 1 [Spatholobus suberectus]